MTIDYTDYGYRDLAESHSHEYLLLPLKRLLGKPAGPVLDVGCGNGALTLKLLAEGYDVFGIDASESGIRLANQRAAGRFAVVDVARADLPPALAGVAFSSVISTEVIEHLYDPRQMLDFARNVLMRSAMGGRLVVSTPYHGYLKNLLLALSGNMDAHFTVLWNGGHIKFFSRKTLEQMLRQQGFRVTGFAGAGRVRWLWKSMLISASVDMTR